MGMIDHNSLGGVGPGDRNRTLFSTYTRLYGRPDGYEFEDAVQSFERAGGDIRPLSISQLYRLRDRFRAFLCCCGNCFSEGVAAWLDSNDHLQHTLNNIALHLPRDAAVARVQAELLGNALKAFGIVRAAKREVCDPLFELLDDPSNENPQNLMLALRGHGIPLKAAAAFTSWGVLSGKRKRIMDALMKRSNIWSDDEEIKDVMRLNDALALPDAGFLLKELSSKSLSVAAAEEERGHHIRMLRICAEQWRETYDAFLPIQRRSPAMHPLAYLRHIRGVQLSADCNEKIPATANEETQQVRGLHSALEYLVPTLQRAAGERAIDQQALEHDDTPLAFTFSSNMIMLTREGVITSHRPPDRDQEIPLPGLMPKSCEQATLIVGWKQNALQRFTINFPVVTPG